MKTATIIPALALSTALTAAADASAAATWTPYFSEESSPNYQWCGYGDEAVSGIRCSGSYCDDVSIRCQDLPYEVLVTDYKWSPWFSEEVELATSISHPNPDRYYKGPLVDNLHVCYSESVGAVVTGMQCSGSNCDNIRLECARPKMWVEGVLEPIRMVDCFWSDYYSEEDPWFAYGATANYWITGVECANSYCDDKRYYVCSMEPPGNSCYDSCGHSSIDGSCWCDSLCTSYGDCCSDYENAC